MINNNGAKIVRDKFKNQLRIFKEHPALHVCYKSIKYDYDNIKHIEYTGDMYDYFKKYEGKEKEFEELYNEYKPDGYLSNWSVCGYLERNYKDELQNRLTDYQLYQGSSYNEYEICKIFDLKNIKSRIINSNYSGLNRLVITKKSEAIKLRDFLYQDDCDLFLGRKKDIFLKFIINKEVWYD